MPNHCDNSLWVVGRPRDVEKFLDASKNPNFGKRHEKPDWKGEFHEDRREWRIFQGNYPCPTELVETEAAFHSDEKLQSALIEREKANLEKYGAKNWYDWCCNNWGTKWDACHAAHERMPYVVAGANSKDRVTISFDTAWAAPEQVIHALVRKYPNLNFVHSYSYEGEENTDFTVDYRLNEGVLEAMVSISTDMTEYEPWEEVSHMLN